MRPKPHILTPQPKRPSPMMAEEGIPLDLGKWWRQRKAQRAAVRKR